MYLYGGSDRPTSRLGSARERIGILFDVLLRFDKRARSIPSNKFVIVPPNLELLRSALTVRRLYQTSFRRHLLTGEFTTVRLPEEFDVVHLTHPIPIRIHGSKTVQTIHDVVPLRLPYTTLDNKREILSRYRVSVRNAHLIVTVSEASKRDIINLLDVPEDRIVVTYQTTDLDPLGPGEQYGLEHALQRYGLRPADYCLFVGAIEPKKNVGRLIEAFLDSEIDVPLVVVGRKAWSWEQEIGRFLNDKTLDARLKFIHYAPRSELRYLYAGAQFMAFPSLYEGFGLPLLEGMRFGLPILTSNISSMPEICGDAALYVDPYDQQDIRNKLERLASEPGLRKSLSSAAIIQAEQFSRERYRSVLCDVYNRIA